MIALEYILIRAIIELFVVRMKFEFFLKFFLDLTAPWGAEQPEGTRWNPRFQIFELQAFNLPPYRWPIQFLSSSHPRARMSGFTNYLTNFRVFPALGAIILNFLGWEPIDIQKKIKFYDFGPRLGHFSICDSPKTIKNEVSGITSE